MMFRSLLPGLAALAISLSVSLPAQAFPEIVDTRCTVPAELTRFNASLPRVADRIARGKSLTVVAIGSSSTAGAGATAPDRSYPSVMEAALALRLPQMKINVVNKGLNGDIDRTMVERFERDVIPFRPHLVIWQVGANTVLRESDPSAVDEIIRDGVRRLKETGADVLLMDLQYAPRMLREPDYPEMEALLTRIALEERVGLFRRFDIMRHWVESKRMNFSDMLIQDGLHLTDLSYGCLGRLMADAVIGNAYRVMAGR